MNRREAISFASVIFGSTLIGAEAFLSGCHSLATKKESLFSGEDILFLDDVGDTIIPATADSGGAKMAKVGAFSSKIVTECYEPKDQKIFTEGLVKLKDVCDKEFKKNFSELTLRDRQSLLEKLDKEAKSYEKLKRQGDPTHYFTMVKQLTVWSYFTSEEGATKALRYIAVPGRYDGVVDYKKGDKAWAT